MVNFVTFNELSLPLSKEPSVNETEISDFLQITDQLSRNYSVNKIRVEVKFQHLLEFATGKSLQQVIGQMNNTALKSSFMSFLSNRIIQTESPLIKDNEEQQTDQFINTQYYYKGLVNTGGLACADIWNTVCLSFNKSDWSETSITLQSLTLNDSNEKIKDETTVYHVSHIRDLNEHELFLQQFINISETPNEILTLADKVNDFLKYKIQFSVHAQEQLNQYYPDNSNLLKSLDKILRSTKHTPSFGIGKPEALKENLSGWSSRRITGEHRLVYKFYDEVIIVKSCFGHYNDL